MKKILSFILFVLLIVSFVACQTGGAAGGLVEKLPASIKTIGYMNVEKTMSMKFMEDLYAQAGDEIVDLMKKFKTVVLGMGDITDSMSSASPTVFALFSGEYKRDEIIELAKSKGDIEELKIGEIDSIKVDDGTILFIAEDLLGFVIGGDAEELVNATKDEKNAIDKESNLYKSTKDMNANMGWLVTDLSSMPGINLADLAMLGIQGEGETKVGISSLGISGDDKNLSFSVSAEFDKEDVVKSLVDGINPLIPSFSAYLSMAPNIPEDIKADLNEIISNTKLKADGKKISTKVDIKVSTIEKLSEMQGLLNSLGGGL